MPKRTVWAGLLLALLSLLAYAPSLSLPLLEDDYKNIWEAQHDGSPADLPRLLQDDIARVRATGHWTIYLLWELFHFAPRAFRASSLILHIADTLLLYAIGLAWARMRAAAFWAAAFFAIHEGHQEAIMWFSGNNELLLFLFGGGSLLCWILAGSRPRGQWTLRAAGLMLFVLALLSKESAFILVPLLLLVTPTAEWRKQAVHLLPYCALAAVAVISIAITRGHSFRFTDGSFSLHAPVWLTLPRNFGRVLWIWGVLSAGLLLFTRAPAELRRSALIALAWIAIGLFPYSFLIYSSQIPSRQLYLASAGLSFLFGLAMVHLLEITRGRAWIPAVVMLAVLVHNVGYIWIKKQRQFRERAEPTEELIRLARQTDGLILVQCFPRHSSIAEPAIFVALNRYPSNLVFDESQLGGGTPAATFCFREH